jgi:hypothetical protein
LGSRSPKGFPGPRSRARAWARGPLKTGHFANIYVTGVAEYKRTSFARTDPGLATKLTVAVEAPTTSHELPVAKLQAWLDTNGKTPREQAVKVTLRQILGRMNGHAR